MAAAFVVTAGSALPAQAQPHVDAAHESIVASLPSPTARLVKMRMEHRLSERFGVPLFCALAIATCIETYDRLARLRWVGVADEDYEASAIKLIQIDEHSRAYDEASSAIVLSPRDSVLEMQRLFNGAPWDHRLSSPQGWEVANMDDDSLSAELVEGLVGREVDAGGHLSCGANPGFYDRFFAPDLIQFGIFVGYFDIKHVEGVPRSDGKYQHHLSDLGVRAQTIIEQGLRAQGLREIVSEHDGHRKLFHGELVHRGSYKPVIVEVVNANVQCPDDPLIKAGIYYRGEYGRNSCSQQRTMTRVSNERYEYSLREHQLTAYLGHARGVMTPRSDPPLSIRARGPSFAPFWSSANPVALRKGALESSLPWKFPEKIVNINACSSFQHYVGYVNTTRQRILDSGLDSQLTFISNRHKNSLSFYPHSTVALVTGLIEHKCGAVIRRAMDDHPQIHQQVRERVVRDDVIIDGQLGSYNSYTMGHPPVRQDASEDYVTYGQAPTDPWKFPSLSAIRERWEWRYASPPMESYTKLKAVEEGLESRPEAEWWR